MASSRPMGLPVGILGPVGIRVVSLLARLGLAAVWLASGWAKASDPAQTLLAVRAYRLLPESAVHVVAIGLPSLEIALGLLLLVGLATRWAAITSIALLAVLIAGVASAWARGLQIDCGCFGGGGEDAAANWRTYGVEILRDIGFLALAGWLAVFPRSPWSLGAGSRPPHDYGGDLDPAHAQLDPARSPIAKVKKD